MTEGEFKGVHGRVARIAGQQRVVVELFEGCLVATAYVPREAMRKHIIKYVTNIEDFLAFRVGNYDNTAEREQF